MKILRSCISKINNLTKNIFWAGIVIILILFLQNYGYYLHDVISDGHKAKSIRSKLLGRWIPVRKEGFRNEILDKQKNSLSFAKYFYTAGSEIIFRSYSIDIVEEGTINNKKVKYYWRPSKRGSNEFHNLIKYLDDNTLVMGVGGFDDLVIVYQKAK